MKVRFYQLNLSNGEGRVWYFEIRTKSGEWLIWPSAARTRAEAKAKARAVIQEIRNSKG